MGHKPTIMRYESTNTTNMRIETSRIGTWFSDQVGTKLIKLVVFFNKQHETITEPANNAANMR